MIQQLNQGSPKRRSSPLRLPSAARRIARSLALAALLAASPLCSEAAIAGPPAAHASHPLGAHVAEASQRFGIPENWIWAVMRQESGGNPKAVSPVGAQGLMQIMPATWAMLTARYDLGSNAFEPRANIHAGAAYLRMMWDRYRDLRLTLAAYNAGPGRVDAYASGRRGLPAETVNYVARIAPSLGTSGIASPAAVPLLDAQSWRSSDLFVERDGHNNLRSKSDFGDASPPPQQSSSSLFVAVGTGE